MTKKIFYYLTSLCLLITIFTGFQVHAEAKTSSNVDAIISLKVKSLKNKHGYKSSDIVPVKLSGKAIPEIAAMYYYMVGPGGGLDYNTLTEIHRYNADTKKWYLAKTYKFNEMESPLISITKGKMLDKVKEQLVVGTIGGSGNFLSPKLLYSKDGKSLSI